MMRITFPNWKRIALSIMDGNTWIYEPLENKIARELEEAFNKGKVRGRMEILEQYKNLQGIVDINENNNLYE